MSGSSVLPDKENLRRAVRWLLAEGTHTAADIEEASARYNLSP